MRRKLAALLIPVIAVTVLDQWTKYLVRTTPSLQDWTIIPGWLSFHYTQNPGMALGLDWLTTPVISLVAIAATIGIFVYVFQILNSANVPFLVCLGLVLGGALGNIIDRLIMAYIQGYGGLLDGHVVDFIHFTLQINDFPVFPYIFNVADMAISVSLAILVIFHKRILPEEKKEIQEDSAPEGVGAPSEESPQTDSPNNSVK